eukprot:CAMPEP_0117654926 /NCGR_PEP_ID=MMETSP0804-20121206/4007_1 /TAXON_ID=1074897 /ORGANISM="Tetraselmis astigmatica, Strain CCMP880" /LENGTH=196 /DNA_ID=CAMNT_0005461245 /DNA_START=142 /DNA_END=732 /DNA_ORIENTATION=+
MARSRAAARSAAEGLVLLVVWSLLAPRAAGDCLVGDVMHQEGISTGVIGYTCVGPSAYEGTEGVCTNGEVVNEPFQGECSRSAPFCVQCGDLDTTGAALCHSTPEAPEHCSQGSVTGVSDPISDQVSDPISDRGSDPISDRGSDMISDNEPDNVPGAEESLPTVEIVDAVSSTRGGSALLPLAFTFAAVATLAFLQ